MKKSTQDKYLSRLYMIVAVVASVLVVAADTLTLAFVGFEPVLLLVVTVFIAIIAISYTIWVSVTQKNGYRQPVDWQLLIQQPTTLTNLSAKTFDQMRAYIPTPAEIAMPMYDDDGVLLSPDYDTEALAAVRRKWPWIFVYNKRISLPAVSLNPLIWITAIGLNEPLIMLFSLAGTLISIGATVPGLVDWWSWRIMLTQEFLMPLYIPPRWMPWLKRWDAPFPVEDMSASVSASSFEQWFKSGTLIADTFRQDDDAIKHNRWLPFADNIRDLILEKNTALWQWKHGR